MNKKLQTKRASQLQLVWHVCDFHVGNQYAAFDLFLPIDTHSPYLALILFLLEVCFWSSPSRIIMHVAVVCSSSYMHHIYKLNINLSKLYCHNVFMYLYMMAVLQYEKSIGPKCRNTCKADRKQ